MDQTVSELPHGEKLCDSVYRFHKPTVPVQLEVVFIHGLEHDNCGAAYWSTWVARDGTQENVWPMTWLPAQFPFAEVFALKYDASIKRTATDGRMDLFLVGETLVQELVDMGHIGQSGVPVVFVCHGFGGLVAKQIVVTAKHRFSQDIKRLAKRHCGCHDRCKYCRTHLGAGVVGVIFGLLTCPMVQVNVHVEEVADNNDDDAMESYLLLNEGLHPYRLFLVFGLSLAVFFALYSVRVPYATEFHFLHGGLGDEYW